MSFRVAKVDRGQLEKASATVYKVTQVLFGTNT